MKRVLAAALVFAACGEPGGSFFDDPTQPLPPQLSELGVGADGTASEPLRAYEPLWPLWSNGSTKQRFVFLPGPIDTHDPARWEFPVGTVLLKTFSYDRPIETRVLRRLEDGWQLDAYLWNDDGSDATLLPLDESVDLPVTVDGEAFTHRVPSRLDCRTCHESAPVPALGFAAIQLDDVTLAEIGAEAARITDPDPATRDVLGYFQGNCVHCHNGGGGPSASFDLRHDVALANIIDQPVASSASAQGIRVVPGSPSTSILFLAMSGESDDPTIKPMPPLGVQRRDAAEIERLRAWITALAP